MAKEVKKRVSFVIQGEDNTFCKVYSSVESTTEENALAEIGKRFPKNIIIDLSFLALKQFR